MSYLDWLGPGCRNNSSWLCCMANGHLWSRLLSFLEGYEKSYRYVYSDDNCHELIMMIIIEEVSWPAGALEESGLEEQPELTKEQMDLMQEQERQALDDR